MYNMSSQRYLSVGHRKGVDPETLKNCVKAIQRVKTVDKRLYPLLTLNHLSHSTGISYGYLRNIISRKFHPYRHFMMQKRLPGRRNKRMINIPEGKLMACQKWISENILKYGTPHSSSYAYHPQSNPVHAAWLHKNSTWLIKVDIEDFFHAISEHDVYRVFRSLGYQNLLSFELARICTIACDGSNRGSDKLKKYGKNVVDAYISPNTGFLPQGAPTSPMLSNLVMSSVDAVLFDLATANNMRFSRYADDIVFSCTDDRNKSEVITLKNKILKVLNQKGFRPNSRKTVIRGPGTRRIVLGMLVNGDEPKLPKEYKDMIRLHLHYLTHPNFGPSLHAKHRKTSIFKMYHHVLGLIYWAKSVEPDLGKKFLTEFNSIKWPPIDKISHFV